MGSKLFTAVATVAIKSAPVVVDVHATIAVATCKNAAIKATVASAIWV
jgi:hypothetical protein